MTSVLLAQEQSLSLRLQQYGLFAGFQVVQDHLGHMLVRRH